VRRLPQRVSLVAQTADILRADILAGTWPRGLPGELELSGRLHVSRVTLRAALAQLEREGLLRAGQGRRREVVRPASPVATASLRRAVALLTPLPLHRLPASVLYWVDELREHLEALGWPLEIHESAAAYRARPVQVLEELAARARPSGWVLYHSTPAMQRWFAATGRPAVIAGSRHEGVLLPSVDVDYAEAARHAAHRLRSLGHRRLALLWPDSNLAGDLSSSQAFLAAAEGLDVTSARHDSTVRGVSLALQRLFAGPGSPTALFVFQATHALTTLGWLQRRGLRVPDDVSLLSRDHDPFLECALPAPSRYSVPAARFARELSRAVADLVTGAPPARPRARLIMPDFVKGETLAPNPSA
jgi:DNA-binding LacI/PurR family transcriptional regulator